MVLTVAEMAAHLERLTYRPGWTFEVYEGRYEGPHLVIRADVPNAYQPDQTTMLDIHSMLPPMRDVGQFEEWLLWRLQRIEVHEACEWFRRDGRPVVDPHREHAGLDVQA